MRACDTLMKHHALLLVLIVVLLSERHRTDATISPKIIGGVTVSSAERYPYMISYQETGGERHVCGATLIAPDVALLAAHCQRFDAEIHVNKHHVNEPDEEKFERFLVQDYYIHPSYDFVSFPFDFMVVKLDGVSTTAKPVRLNPINQVPIAGTNLTVLGWGRNDENNEDSFSETLQQAQLASLTNQDCQIRWNDPITDSMICAQANGNGFDCDGDSGGPLLLAGTTAEEDVQVGIVSWGAKDCVTSETPSVFARVSEAHKWITSTVCHISSSPPSDFDCSSTFSPAPSSSPSRPTTSPAPTFEQVMVTFILQLDKFPRETGYFLTDSVGKVLMKEGPAAFTEPQGQIRRELYLSAEQAYSLTVFDSRQDGFCCTHGAGIWAVYLGPVRQNRLLASGKGDFETSLTAKFVASDTAVIESDREEEVVNSTGTFPVTVFLISSATAGDLWWSMRRVDRPGRPLVGVAAVGEYASLPPQQPSTTTIMLEEGGVYCFTAGDSSSNTFQYRLFVGSEDASDASALAFEKSQQLGPSRSSYNFVAQLPSESTLLTSSIPPSLYLRMRFDTYPEEFGWVLLGSPEDQFQVSTDETEEDLVVMAFGPTEPYSELLQNQVLDEGIPIPTIAPGLKRRLTMIFHDSGRDGLCCGYGSGGVQLYLGPPEDGTLLFEDAFESQERVAYSFVITGAGEGSSSASMLDATTRLTLIALLLLSFIATNN